jgi:uncharacterized protein with HEPN domain
MPAKDPLVYLMHIRDCCERIVSYTSRAGPQWPSEPMVMDAVLRNLEIIGEAARKADAGFRATHPEIPWQSMIGARNILIHAYESLKPQIIQGMVDTDIPALLAAVQRVLGEAGR